MAADPSDAEEYVDPVTAVFEEIEADLIGIIASALAAGTSTATLRRLLMAKVAGYAGRVQRLIGQALIDAFLRGQETAEEDAEISIGRRAKPPKTHPVKAVLGRLIRQAPAKALRIHDEANDAVTDAMTAGRYGTRKAAAADLLQKYAAKGIVGFTDSVGRSWDLVSYAEVVTRTTTAQTLVDAHLQRLQSMGKDLVIVSEAPESCPICDEWEGAVLSISGRTRPGRQEIDGHTVTVKGTVAQAKAAGVWHPSCRHRVGLMIPGRTRPIEASKDPDAYKIRQQQRARERRVREHKRRVLAAEAAAGKTSPEAKAARAKLRAYQSEFTAWRKANGLKDLSGRTSLKVR